MLLCASEQALPALCNHHTDSHRLRFLAVASLSTAVDVGHCCCQTGGQYTVYMLGQKFIYE